MSIAAPVGSVTVLYLRRTLAEGWRSGLVTAAGAATADAFYAAVVAFGLSAISAFLISISTPVRLIGGLFLLYIGIRTIFTPPAELAARADGVGLWGKYASAVLITVTNPLTIILFTGIFTGSGLALSGTGDAACAIALAVGLPLGSLTWAAGFVAVAALLKHRIPTGAMRWINRVSGAAIALFALISLLG